MATKENFEDVKKIWSEALAPANAMEGRLANSIARQDFLMGATIRRALEINQDPMFSRYMRIHRDMAASLDSMVSAFQTLRRESASAEPPPPVAAAKAKVIPFPKAATKHVGRPRKVEMKPEPLPLAALHERYRRRDKDPGESPSLDFDLAA